MEALEEWFKANGGFLHPAVHLAQDEEHGSHFRATAAIEPGTHVLTVPHHLALSNLNAQVDDDFPVFRTHAKFFTVEALSFFYLMAQWIHKDKSFWKPYLDTLPTPEQGFETPMFFDEEDRKWLEGTDLHPTLLAREAIWKKYWEDGVQILRFAGMDVTEYTWDLFKWSATVFTSRSFNSRTVTPTDSKYWTAYKHTPEGRQTALLDLTHYDNDWKNFSVLFPVMDAGNHNPNAKVDWAYNPGRFSLTVSEKVEPGSQIFNNYGPKSNEELLMGYGFCAPGNPYDGLLLAMRAPPPPLQQMLQITHPGYFKTDGSWNSDAATFRLLRSKLQDTSSATPFEQAWTAVPAPLAELFCYVVQLERGVDVTPIEDPEQYLYHGEGRRYLTRIAIYITMSLMPKQNKLEAANAALPDLPSNSRQAAAKLYRDVQSEVIDSVQTRMSAYLKQLESSASPTTVAPAIWTLENALSVLATEAPNLHKSFLSGLKYALGTSKLRKFRGTEHEEQIFTILLCFLYLAFTTQPDSSSQNGLLASWIKALVEEYGQPEFEEEDEGDEEAGEYLERVRRAATFLPGSIWSSELWREGFVLDFGVRVTKSQGTYMDVGVEDEEDVRYVVYLHV